jgi:peptidoglycan/xylan/chitin deacetylase (PgdA/CDA1 family)
VAALASVAAAAALLIVLAGGGRAIRRRHHILVAGPAPTSLRRARRGTAAGGLRAVMAGGNAEIRRLVAIGLPLYCGGPRGDEVAFTFDDGPGVYTYLALKKLRQAHERATFFVVGKSINGFPGYLPRELRLATIGDHTYTHPDLVALGPVEVTSQLRRTAQLIKAQSGETVDLWRPPYGASDASVRRIAQRLGLLETLWSVDSRDSLGANWAAIIKVVEAGLRPGAIVELHENRGQTIRALTSLLPYLHHRHLRSVSLPELLASDPPSLTQLRRGWSGCGERAIPAVATGAE